MGKDNKPANYEPVTLWNNLGAAIFNSSLKYKKLNKKD